MWPQRRRPHPRGERPRPCPRSRFTVTPRRCHLGENLAGGRGVTVGRGCCLWKGAEQLKPARSKLESLFPEWLFRRKKTSSKSQPRKPAIARETGVGGQEGLQNSGPREPCACAKPCRAMARGTFPGARLAWRPGTRTPHPGRPCPAPGREDTQPERSQGFTVCKMGLCREGPRIRRWGRGGTRCGDSLGAALASALGPRVRGCA